MALHALGVKIELLCCSPNRTVLRSGRDLLLACMTRLVALLEAVARRAPSSRILQIVLPLF